MGGLDLSVKPNSSGRSSGRRSSGRSVNTSRSKRSLFSFRKKNDGDDNSSLDSREYDDRNDVSGTPRRASSTARRTTKNVSPRTMSQAALEVRMKKIEVERKRMQVEESYEQAKMDLISALCCGFMDDEESFFTDDSSEGLTYTDGTRDTFEESTVMSPVKIDVKRKPKVTKNKPVRGAKNERKADKTKANERKAAERKAAETKAAERKAAERKADERTIETIESPVPTENSLTVMGSSTSSPTAAAAEPSFFTEGVDWMIETTTGLWGGANESANAPPAVPAKGTTKETPTELWSSPDESAHAPPTVPAKGPTWPKKNPWKPKSQQPEAGDPRDPLLLALRTKKNGPAPGRRDKYALGEKHGQVNSSVPTLEPSHSSLRPVHATAGNVQDLSANASMPLYQPMPAYAPYQDLPANASMPLYQPLPAYAPYQDLSANASIPYYEPMPAHAPYQDLSANTSMPYYEPMPTHEAFQDLPADASMPMYGSMPTHAAVSTPVGQLIDSDTGSPIGESQSKVVPKSILRSNTKHSRYATSSPEMPGEAKRSAASEAKVVQVRSAKEKASPKPRKSKSSSTRNQDRYAARIEF